MSCPVISAAILSAIVMLPDASQAPHAVPMAVGGSVASKPTSPSTASPMEATGDFTRHVATILLAEGVVQKAIQSSILCASESSGGMSKSDILRCEHCGFAISNECTAKVDCSTHSLVAYYSSEQRQGTPPELFEEELWTSMPPVVFYTGGDPSGAAAPPRQSRPP